MFSTIIIFVVIGCVYSETMDVKKSFADNLIVPDVVDVAPQQLAEVSYQSGVAAELGNELTPTQVKDIPQVKWTAEHGALYTVLMTDPDAPTHASPTFREVRHWLVVNVPETDVAKGDTLFEFIGSGPPKDTGLHRYVILVFKQKGKISTDRVPVITNRSREGRIKLKTRDLIEQFELKELAAGNFYRAQYDDYVPILYEQLGGPPPKP